MTTKPTPREIIAVRCKGSYVNMTAGALADSIERDLATNGYRIVSEGDLRADDRDTLEHFARHLPAPLRWAVKRTQAWQLAMGVEGR